MSQNNNDDLKKENIIKTGFLYKKSKYLGNWKKRFIVLTDNYIFSYTDEKPDSECTMNLLLKDCYGPKNLEMENKNEYGFSFCNDGKIYCFKTNRLEEKHEWFTTLRDALAN